MNTLLLVGNQLFRPPVSSAKQAIPVGILCPFLSHPQFAGGSTERSTMSRYNRDRSPLTRATFNMSLLD